MIQPTKTMEDLERGVVNEEAENDDLCFIFADDDDSVGKDQKKVAFEGDASSSSQQPSNPKPLHEGNEKAADESLASSYSEIPSLPTRRRKELDRRKPTVVRRKESKDIETGSSLEHACVCQVICDKLCSKPMDPRDRWWKQFVQSRITESNQNREPRIVYQYRITTHKTSRGYMGLLRTAEEDYRVIKGVNVLVSNYLLWTFQTPMFFVFVSAAVMYTLLTVVFGAMIYGLGRYEPQCLSVDGEDFDARGHHFQDAFSLSWQTFSTAGFGAVRPALASDHHSCAWLNMLAALESFTGVLFIGFCTAVVFGKIIRVQAVANVEFSDPIVVRYGSGVLPADDSISDSSSEGVSQDNKKEVRARVLTRSKSVRDLMHGKDFPCPVLEFRLMNQLHDQVGGEICNAHINVVATLLANPGAPATLRNSLLRRGHRRRSFSSSVHSGSIMLQGSAHRAAVAGDRLFRKTGASYVFRKSGNLLQRLNRSLQPVSEHQSPVVSEAGSVKSGHGDGSDQDHHYESMSLPVIVDEEPSRSLIPRLIFSKLDIETDQHPFLKRVWTIRHVLNETSPMLSKKARRLIETNRGFWPEELNNHEQVRKHILFHQIIVNFSGIANVSGNAVYAQKIYDKVDMNIGYRLATMLFKSGDGRLIVDESLLNDVTEQYGGGAEPFANVVDRPEALTNAMAAAARASADVVKATADVAVAAGKAASVQVATSASALQRGWGSQDEEASAGLAF